METAARSKYRTQSPIAELLLRIRVTTAFRFRGDGESIAIGKTATQRDVTVIIVRNNDRESAGARLLRTTFT